MSLILRINMKRPATPFDSEDFVKNLPNRPGIYRMWSQEGKLLYIGKAKDLRKRVASYFGANSKNPKTSLILKKLKSMDYVVTDNESAAFILENNLIKETHPKYNVLLRDDKSYPYLYISTHEPFPRLVFYRGMRGIKGRFFGPYANTADVKQTIGLLQKTFLVRNCSNSFFSHRTRPCLQYQIKRCSAPCVGLITKQAYLKEIKLMLQFLEGKNRDVINVLIEEMQCIASRLHFEKAAEIRDKVVILRKLLDQRTAGDVGENYDAVAACINAQDGCIHVLKVRQGLTMGSQTYFPFPVASLENMNENQLLTLFFSQLYLKPSQPQARIHTIVCSHSPDEKDILIGALKQNLGYKVTFVVKPRKGRKDALCQAQVSAKAALLGRASCRTSIRKKFHLLEKLLNLPTKLKRVECFDISHTAGHEITASCVVFAVDEGPVKRDYRIFKIDDIGAGDDYAAIYQAVKRRYTRIFNKEFPAPQLLLIDGGKGQAGKATLALDELGFDKTAVFGVAKGRQRRAGEELIVCSKSKNILRLEPNCLELRFIQQIRDEAHRFAILGHKKRRCKARHKSVLHDIVGLGPKRIHNLVHLFGGIQHIGIASLHELQKVPGIGPSMAEAIYARLH